MFFKLLSLCFAIMVSSVHSQRRFGAGRNLNSFEPAQCHLPRHPCRLRVSLQDLEGHTIDNYTAYTCSCSGSRQCPDDWSLPHRVVSRSLVSESFNTTLSMMFCDEVAPLRVCAVGEPSIEVSGFLQIPNELDNYNCRCTDGIPLQLHERRFENFRYHHVYICDNHKPTCFLPHTPCMTIRQDKTEYHCKCGGHSRCVADGDWTHQSVVLPGYCQI